jgi:hypothetical protein
MAMPPGLAPFDGGAGVLATGDAEGGGVGEGMEGGAPSVAADASMDAAAAATVAAVVAAAIEAVLKAGRARSPVPCRNIHTDNRSNDPGTCITGRR